MEIRQPIHSDHARTLDTTGLRRQFLVEDLFQPDRATLTYSQIDRIIVGGILPVSAPVRFAPELGRHTGTDFFLQRRELGLINIGGAARVTVDGEVFEIGAREALYVGQGAKDLGFETLAAIPISALKGDNILAPSGSLWNTMPCHTHDRRMEVYFYFDMAADAVVFHMLGQPTETRHLVVRNEQAVINPSWSIHSGVGTQAYTFIWGMVGENQVFKDMDHVAMTTLL